MKPTTAQLRHAAMVAGCRSFSEAARRCRVSQPTISNSVSDLEDFLGKKLFKRSTRSVDLTPFGVLLLPVIAEAVAAIDRVTVEANAHLNPANKLLRVAFTPLLDIASVDAFFAAYRLNHPEVDVVFKECSHDSLEDRLLSEQIDIAFAHDIPPRKELRRCQLFSDVLHYVPANGDIDAEVTRVSIRDIAKAPLLLTDGSCGLAATTLGLFDAEGIVPQLYGGRAMSHATLKDWAELGIGGAVLPLSKLSAANQRYPTVEIDNAIQRIDYQAVWARSSEATPHLAKLFRELPRVASALLGPAAKV